VLSEKQAVKKIKQTFPVSVIVGQIEYNDLYIFSLKLPLVAEEGFDPFYSVDKHTGAVKDFSILTDGNIDEILTLFKKTK
jgi:hypothetical protein